MHDIALEVSGIILKFKKRIILDDVNFYVKKGSLFAITGRSGAGKSTLIKVILGLTKISKGKVTFFKEGKPEKKFRKIIGYASQENAFYDKLSVMENMRLFARLYNMSSKIKVNRINDVLRIFDLTNTKNTIAEHLSGGMKRRLDIALSVLNDPEIIIMDEPTNGLDITLQTDLWNYIMKLNEMGKTIIISTHNITDIKKYCSDFGILFRQKVFTKDKLKDITNLKVSDLEKAIQNLYRMEREDETI